MKSGLRRLRNAAAGPPVPMSRPANGRGLIYDLGAGTTDKLAQLRTYRSNGTVHSIVSLLQSAPAGPRWHLYKQQPVDGRRRYSTADVGDDQRPEVLNHAAMKLWNSPNEFHSGFEFREGSNQHLELTGET